MVVLVCSSTGVYVYTLLRGLCVCVCVCNYEEVNVQPTIDFGKGSH